MTYKEYTCRTHQSDLTFKKSTVEKKYIQKDHEKNKISSVKNEMHCINKFSIDNPYAPEILDVDDTSYIMKRYDFSIGDTKRINNNNVRKLLFTCSLKEIFNQLNKIENILKERNIIHKDINPGNILFCEKEKKLKLIDFYWASTDDINIDFVKGINGIYGEDSKAFTTIRKQIAKIEKKVKAEVHASKTILAQLGKVYHDGSAKHKGKTYHPIDIPYYRNNQYHKDIDYEFNNIISNIKNPIESVIDIGCAAGYYLFNLSRAYQMNKVVGYEADPTMLSFLKTSKDIFCLDNFNLNSGVDINTKFQDVDLSICMNVHMWLEKQFGKGVDVIISNLIKHSKEMFFQTAGAESAGIYLVKWLKSKQDIKEYLERLGGKRVEFISQSKRGGKRYLFKIGD